MSEIPIILSIVVGVIAIIVLYKPFFGKEKDFIESFAYTFRPKGENWLDYDYFVALEKIIKFVIFIIIVAVIGVLAYIFLFIKLHFYL